MRVVQEEDALDRGDVLEPQRVADLHAAHVDLDRLRHLHRQRLDVQHAGGRRQHAALAHAGSVLRTGQVERDGRLDRLVEAHLLQVDVPDVTADRIALVRLEDGRVGVTLAVEDDVEHRVQARGAGQRRAQHAPVDDEGARGRFP